MLKKASMLSQSEVSIKTHKNTRMKQSTFRLIVIIIDSINNTDALVIVTTPTRITRISLVKDPG